MDSLFQAVADGDIEEVEQLLSSGECQVNCTDSEGSTPLHIACVEGYFDLVRVLVRYGADFTAKDKCNDTPLTLATHNKKFDCVLAIIKTFGCNVNVRGSFGRTLLHFACIEGNLELVHVLVQGCKADMNIRDNCNYTALMSAVLFEQYEVWKLLVCDYGCDPNVKNPPDGNSLLHIACADGNIDLVHVLVQDCKAGLNIRNNNNATPLMTAARTNQYNVWKSLVCDYGCDPNVRDSNYDSLLHIACADGNIDLVHVLVRDCKADLNATNNDDDTPLMIAARNSQYNVWKTLVCDYGCDPNITDINGKTLLHTACMEGRIDLVDVLVRDCKADLNIRDHNDDTPLMIAARTNYYMWTSLVRDYGCNPNLKDSSGNALLHTACAIGNSDLVHTLIQDCKADLSICDDNNDTPLMIAARKNQYDIVKSLVRDYGCDPNIRDSNYDSLLHIACADGKIDLVLVLIRDCKADLNATNNDDDTPLMIAARNSQYNVWKTLVCDYGCDPNVRGISGESLLHIACAQGNIDLVHILVQDCKADLNFKDYYGNTPLVMALNEKRYELVKLLVYGDYGCDFNVKDSNGDSLLHIAYIHTTVLRISNKYLGLIGEHHKPLLKVDNIFKFVKLLINNYGCDPNILDSNGRSLLHIACANGDIKLVHILIQECKADLNIRDNNSDTPFMTAARNFKHEVVKLLICDYGCDPNITDINGKTLLHTACIEGRIDLVDVLVRDCKADLNIRDHNDDTPLMIAARTNYYMWTSLVRDYGCNPNLKDSSGNALLHTACAIGNIDLIHTLIRDCKADLSICDDNNDTPLMIAARKNQYDIVKSLVRDYGCDPNIRDSNYDSLLHIACANGNIDLVHVLVRDCKADMNIRDNLNNTPLITAVENSKCDMVKLLISDYKCDASITDSKGRSLLHKAGGVEVLKLLIEEYKMSPLLTDNDGNTPLHLFSGGYKISHFKCVQVLIFDFHAPLFIHNKEGKAPKDMVRDDMRQLTGSLFARYLAEHGKEIQADYKSMQLLAEKRYFGSHFICRLFVVGHPGAGKSSLVETMKREGLLKSFSRVSEKLVPPHTAGIIPSIFHSGSFGRVQFYDLAGDPEYYSSHAAILERLFQSNIGTNVSIIVLNLLEDDVEIEKKYLFWLNFISFSFKRLKELPSFIVIGSHSDQLPKQKEVSRKKSYIQELISMHERESVYLSLDCCSPRSSNIRLLRNSIHELAKKSQPYSLSLEQSILLGLLEKDFSNVTACTAQTIVNHIIELNLSLPRSVSLLYPILQKLQAIGVLLLVGDKEEDCYIVLKVAELTNEVHRKLFSEDAFSTYPSLASFNIGLLPQSLLQEVLPNHITKECLIQLQYCQEVSHIEIDRDYSVSPSIVGPDSALPDESYLFFPALCNLDKKNISWKTHHEHSYSIGWLARCHNPHDYFPPRFLHVLLLRIALRFTLIVPSCVEDEISPDHKQLKRRCKIWKTGVHWLSEEGVECEVDIIGSKEIVVSLQSIEESKTCLSVLNSVISCVMEAKAEFCDFIVLDFFLLDKVSCLTDSNLFSVEDVERVLREGKPSVLSVDGENLLSSSKLLHVSSSIWSSLFPIDEHLVLKYIETIVKEWIVLGINLELSSTVLNVIEANYPSDVIRCKTEMVINWLSSSLPHPPCWWSLVKALCETGEIACAERITKDKGEHIALQEKLINSQDSHLTPDKEFLESFAGVVGSKWPYLASLLSLTSSIIEEVRREGEGLTQRERALIMLHKWVSREEATYSQLYQKLKPVSLFHYGK